MAESRLMKTPSPKVRANPFMRDDPNQNKIIEMIILAVFASRIESHARLKPAFNASRMP